MKREDLRILIVEDDFIINMYIEQILMNNNYQVAGIIGRGEDVLDKIAACNPNLVFMDISLKGQMSGIDAAALVKEKYGNEIPIIFVTGNSDRIRNDDRVPNINPLGILIKPVNDMNIIEKLEELFPE